MCAVVHKCVHVCGIYVSRVLVGGKNRLLVLVLGMRSDNDECVL